MATQELDPHSVLGVSPGASESEIKTAYRYLARKFHPDANPGDANAETWFKKVEAAYSALKNKPPGWRPTITPPPSRPAQGPSDAEFLRLRDEFARYVAQLAEQLCRLAQYGPYSMGALWTEDDDDYAERHGYVAPTSPAASPRAHHPAPFLVLIGVVALALFVRSSSRDSTAAPRASSTEWVAFEAGCRVREEPSVESDKIGFATPGVAFAVVENHRGWRHIKLDNGTLGWAGCRPAAGKE